MAGSTWFVAALFTSTSTRPWRPSAASTTAAGASGSARSQATTVASVSVARNLLESVLSPRDEHDMSARGVEDLCEARAEPRARAGHDRDAPVEPEAGEGIDVRHGVLTGIGAPPGTRTLNLVMKRH